MAIEGARELAAELKAIEQGKGRPVYLVFGSESYLVRESADALAAALGRATGADVARVDATGKSVEAVLEPVTALSLFSSAQIALVRNFAHLLTGDDADRLLHGIDVGVGEGSALVLVATGATPADKIDKRVKGYKGLAKRGVVLEMNTQKPEDLADWMRRKATDAGLKLPANASELLLARVGPDMGLLKGELDKAILFCHGRDRIDVSDLEMLVGKSREDAVWDVTEAVSRGDARGALTILEDLVTTGTFPLVVLALLVRQTRHLLQARLLWDAAGNPPFGDMRSFQSRVGPRVPKGAFGGGPDDVTTIHPFASYKRFEAAREQDARELRDQLSRLRRADRDAKTGAAAGAHEVVQELLLDLAARARNVA
ncbi:MAG: DNA polymerase III subunit delta [bacterium]|nr:DNA polymerase III subunit delta [Gemmatimonadota bacterium]